MSNKYIYDKTPIKHRIKRLRRLFAVPIAIALVLIIIAIILIYKTSHRHQNITGPLKITKVQTSSTRNVQEPYFSFELPSSWIQTASTNNATTHSITWMDRVKMNDSRWLTVYIDQIPSDIPVNRILPIAANVNGDGIAYGSMSDNCFNFIQVTNYEQYVTTSWQNVNFICDVPHRAENNIGTGTVGQPIDQTIITGQTMGTHKYFFLYTDDDSDPNYSILYQALSSFQAK
jgi:hypothetical protein